MRAGHERVDIPASRVKEDVLKVLAEEGYIASYRRVEEKGRPLLRVGLKYDPEGEPIVNGLERVSRPGRRVYARRPRRFPRCSAGSGSPSSRRRGGSLTGRQARESRLGGEILCNVW